MATMGQSFKAAREKKRTSLSQAALKTHIKIQHLEAMERDDFSRMPAPIYARGFIRSYCDFLGLEPAAFLQEYSEKYGGTKRPAVPVDAKIIKTVPGDQPLPSSIGKNPDAAAHDTTEENGGSSPGRFSAPNLQTLAIGGLIVAAILVVIAIARFWPALQHDNREGSHVVEVKRPIAHSTLAVMREPPEPYVQITKTGAPVP